MRATDPTAFEVTYSGPAVDDGRVTFEDLEQAASGCINLVTAAASALWGDDATCEVETVTVPKAGRITVLFVCEDTSGRRRHDWERTIVSSLLGGPLA